MRRAFLLALVLGGCGILDEGEPFTEADRQRFEREAWARRNQQRQATQKLTRQQIQDQLVRTLGGVR